MKIGDNVRVNKCDVCPAIIGKTAKVKGFGDDTVVLLNYGRGRPQAGRPNGVILNDVSVVAEEVVVNTVEVTKKS